ncbi:CocE/NonD family hydrolase [Telmatocola sphagniphila]|uniref:CocE/NonD family hydrolase n=2 Tax=Telmatocola sphagniphila TaxID=1123043 RepID=A0A8E6BBB3_9BACT|nr:CocE/NonD family hydrolase [Telmatocola sphagniphila]
MRPSATISDEERLNREFFLSHYTKYEFRIPMRDGKKLFTAVYAPKDISKTYPMLLMRTPYSVGPYGVDQLTPPRVPAGFLKEGYIFVAQDVRGRWMSEGEFVNMRPYIVDKKGQQFDETSDTYDTIDWLVKNVPNNNGKVGQWGISYPGFYTVCGMIDAHPALKASSPQAPVTDWFVGDDFHHNGALFLPHCFNFLSNFGKPRPEPTKKYGYLPFDHGTPDGYDFFLKMGPLYNADANYMKGQVAFWNEMMIHGTYDEFWKSRNIRQHTKNIKPAVMTVGGWYDAENLFGAIHTFRQVEKTATAPNTLVMGPWVHGGWSRGDGDSLGPVRFNAKTGVYFQEKVQLPFFEYHLKGKGDWKAPKAIVFETGTNQWRNLDSWPPKEAKETVLYLGESAGLSTEKPVAAGFDEFVSDPAKPVPYIEKTSVGMEKEYMIADQRFASRRTDVLTYQTDVFDKDYVIAGPIEVKLFVSTTGSDADWVVKIIDVYPEDYPDLDPNPREIRMGGYQQLIRGDVFRGKFRNSYEKPEPFEPGKMSEVRISLADIYHSIRPGHRLMIQVQSSWFPLVDRNPQVFCDIYSAKEGDFKKQTHRVYHGAEGASQIKMTVLPR